MSISRRSILKVLPTLALPAPVLPLLSGCKSGPAEPQREARPAPPAISRSEREVRLIVPSVATSDGAGVKLRRALGAKSLSMLDPFLLLDEMRSDKPEDYRAGFPTHPHRGFETVTYVIEGAADHKDSLGNEGHLGAGSAQWMTAGRGIVHSEMPTHDATSERLWALQLWVNLPASLKMGKPRYQDIPKQRIPELSVDGSRVRLVAGQVGGSRGPVEGIATSPMMFDVTVEPRGRFVHATPPGHNAFVYVLDGAVSFGEERKVVQRGEVGVLTAGERITMSSEAGGRVLFFAGRPIGEPVARSGPFVMNTEAELEKAWSDYRKGRLVTSG
ncbi:MAG: pirin family protein [Polyangiaceae bacterium]